MTSASNSSDIDLLERDVEAARGRLAADLAKLCAPSTIQDFNRDVKSEGFALKDAAVDAVQAKGRELTRSVIDDVKARAVANPGAALLIGAGVGWHLLRNPPIATTLVGLGLYSLFRAEPRYVAPGTELDTARANLLQQAREAASVVADKASELGAKTGRVVSDLSVATQERLAESASTLLRAEPIPLAPGMEPDTGQSDLLQQARNAATAVADKASELGAKTSRSVSNLTAATQDRVADHASKAADLANDVITDAVSQVQTSANAAVQAARRYAQTPMTNQQKDTLLLGLAGLAVAAAVGSSFMKSRTRA